MPTDCTRRRQYSSIKLLVAVIFVTTLLLVPLTIFRDRQLRKSVPSYEVKGSGSPVGVTFSKDERRRRVERARRLPVKGRRLPSLTFNRSAKTASQLYAAFKKTNRNHVTYASLPEMVNHVTNPDYRFANYSLKVTEEDIETFQASLPPLLENYRSPCWLEYLSSEHVYDQSYYLTRDCMEREAVHKSFSWAYVTYKQRLAKNLHWRVRCMPYFYLLGMPKSGTTDLYVSMVRYVKNVISGARKEPHFWNRRRFGITYSGGCYNAPGLGSARLKDYLDLHDEAAEKTKMRYQQKGNNYYHNMIIGDFTPGTMWSLPKWWRINGNQKLEEPLFTTAHHLHGVWPQSKFVVMLRDPVERAFSQMKYRSLPINGQVAAHFHDLVVNTIEELKRCQPFRGCVYNRTDPLSPDMHGNFIIVPGIYAIFVRDWLKVFPRRQFHFISFENYKRNKSYEIERLLEFLDTDPLDPEFRDRLAKLPVANKGIQTETMWNKTRKILEDFYRPWNNQLADIVDDKTFRWHH